MVCPTMLLPCWPFTDASRQNTSPCLVPCWYTAGTYGIILMGLTDMCNDMFEGMHLIKDTVEPCSWSDQGHTLEPCLYVHSIVCAVAHTVSWIYMKSIFIRMIYPWNVNIICAYNLMVLSCHFSPNHLVRFKLTGLSSPSITSSQNDLWNFNFSYLFIFSKNLLHVVYYKSYP